MKGKNIGLFSCLLLISCQSKLSEKDLNRDAEQLALDKCHTQWVETKIEQVKIKIARLEDSSQLPLQDSLKASVSFRLRKAKDGLEYYTEQRSGYLRNNQEEETKYKSGLYADPDRWKLLNQKADEKMSKMPSCISKEYD